MFWKDGIIRNWDIKGIMLALWYLLCLSTLAKEYLQEWWFEKWRKLWWTKTYFCCANHFPQELHNKTWFAMVTHALAFMLSPGCFSNKNKKIFWRHWSVHLLAALSSFLGSFCPMQEHLLLRMTLLVWQPQKTTSLSGLVWNCMSHFKPPLA